MKLPKPSLTADSGVTNTMDAHSCGLRLSHSTHSIPASKHRSFKLPRNETNGTTTMVTPVEHAAGNINAMLLPAPVPMMTTTGLSCRIMALMAGCCMPLNMAPCPTNFSNWPWMSIARIFFHRRNSSSMASFLASAARVPFLGCTLSADSNIQNRCHAMLTSRNAARLASLLHSDSVINLP